MEILDSAQLMTLLRYLPDPAFVITRSGYYAAAYGGRDARYYHDGSPLVGLFVHEFMEKEKADWLVEVVERTLASERLEVVEYALSGKDLAKLEAIGPTEILWFEARIQALPFQVQGEQAVLWVASNITERHLVEEGLKTLSNTDPLTGLHNRRYFETLFEDDMRKVAKGRPLSLLVLDVDHFKHVNDSHGHTIGDSVLEDLANLVTHDLRRVDYAARWGGEEFVVAMSGSNLQQAVLVAERLRRAVEKYDFVDGLTVTASLGVAQCDVDDQTLADVFTRADSALYEAKSSGRNLVRYQEAEATQSADV